MEAAEALFGERPSLGGPLLDSQESVPVVADFMDISFPAVEAETPSLDHRRGLGQSEPIAFDSRGIVSGAQACPAPQFLGNPRRHRRVLDDRPGGFDRQE
jgi:hypothetical protein